MYAAWLNLSVGLLLFAERKEKDQWKALTL
jgi:hypothetical protein